MGTNLPLLFWLLLLWYGAIFVGLLLLPLLLAVPLLVSVLLRAAALLFHLHALLGWLEVDACVCRPVRVVAGVVAAKRIMVRRFIAPQTYLRVFRSQLAKGECLSTACYLELLWSSGQGSLASSSFSSSEEWPLICRTSTSP